MERKGKAWAVTDRQSKEKKALVEQLEKTPVVQVACEKSWVGRSTYYRWTKEDPDFSKEASEALGRGIQLMNDMAESQLLNSVRNGNMTGIIFWLKSRHPKYGNRVEIRDSREREELTGTEAELVRKILGGYGKRPANPKGNGN